MLRNRGNFFIGFLGELKTLKIFTEISWPLKSLGALDLPIHVEPGLFEWLAWYQDAMPDFMSDTELAEAGYNIDLSHKVKLFYIIMSI